MVDVLVAMSHCPPMVGSNVGVLTVSGGAGAWMSDALEGVGFSVPELDGETQDALRPLFPSYGSVHNPVDATASIVDSGKLAEALSTVVNAPNVDAVVFVTSLAAAGILEREEDALRAVIETSTKPIILYSYTAVSADATPVLERLGLPCYESPRRVTDALDALRRLHAIRHPEEPRPSAGDSSAAVVESPEAMTGLCEYELNELLQDQGITVPRGVLAADVEEAVAAATMLGGLVALKVQSRAALHKREVGGLALGVSGEDDVRRSYATIVDAVSSKVRRETIDGVLVQEMLAPGIEMMIGRLEDAQFGPLIAVGRGGSNVELMADVTYELAPVDPDGARRMLRRLSCWPLLDGEGAAIGALADLVAQISSLDLPVEAEVVELDLNPVMVYPQGRGVAVVDAKAVVATHNPAIKGELKW